VGRGSWGDTKEKGEKVMRQLVIALVLGSLVSMVGPAEA
jgi:hypothetical protein